MTDLITNAVFVFCTYIEKNALVIHLWLVYVKPSIYIMEMYS